MIAKYGLWSAYAVFVGVALATGWHDRLFDFSGPAGIGKGVVLAVWLAFLAYSIQCSRRENIFRTLGAIGKLHWGRQVGIDLYLGAAMFACLIGLNEGSWLVALMWALPILLFVNLATLVYLFVAYETIVARFVS